MIYLGSDHRGLRLKKKILEILTESELLVRDLGNLRYDENDDFVDYSILVGERVVREGALGILICGSGVGMTIGSNKVKGIRAGFCFCPKQARLAKEDDNINVLCLSADLVDEETNVEIVKTFVNCQFMAEEKYIRRINKISKYETTNS